MFFDRYIRDVDDVTKDVGQELKNTAKQIYTGGIILEKLLLVLELVAVALVCIIGIFEDFVNILYAILFLSAYVVVALIQHCIIINIIYRNTIEMYARGENVHYLRKISEQGYAKETKATKATDINKTQNVAQASQNTAPPLDFDSWVCKKCGTQNKKQYGQCKKCGTYRNNETSIELEIPKTYSVADPEEQENVVVDPHIDENWKCWYCGTINSMKYSQCKKCGKFK